MFSFGAEALRAGAAAADGILALAQKIGSAELSIEEAQALRSKDKIKPADGILVYRVDAKLKTGNNPVVVYPKEDLSRAPFHPGDTFQHDDAPFTMKVVSKNEDGSYTLDILFK